jgi:hypothetical protein
MTMTMTIWWHGSSRKGAQLLAFVWSTYLLLAFLGCRRHFILILPFHSAFQLSSWLAHEEHYDRERQARRRERQKKESHFPCTCAAVDPFSLLRFPIIIYLQQPTILAILFSTGINTILLLYPSSLLASSCPCLPLKRHEGRRQKGKQKKSSKRTGGSDGV